MLKKLQQKFRMWQWVALTAICGGGLFLVAPQQLGILLLKATYLCAALAIGYYADRTIFYYARPHEFKAECWRETSTHTYKSERVESAYRAYALVMLRRAIIVGAVVIAFALGL